MKSFAEKIIQFNKQLDFVGKLPNGIRVMNPFKENPDILSISKTFYTRFYKDTNKRKLILGINPGRLGAGATGIPFTDTKRLAEICKINIESFGTHEPSSVFIYDMIKEYGGVKKFYSEYYINSICPLGFTKLNERGKWINFNYYDLPELYDAVKKFMTNCLKTQIKFGIDTEKCFVLGKKNAAFVTEINNEVKIFGSIGVLDHPRFIEQYKNKSRSAYIDSYLKLLKA